MVEVREIIKSLKKRDYTIFMSSHLLGEVQEVCDNAALINRGKLLVYDSIEHLKTLTKVARLEVTTTSDVSQQVIAAVGEMPRVRSTDPVNGRTFIVTFDGTQDERAELLVAIQNLGLKVSGFSPVGLPLEMMYMELIKESR
jgi:ABC-2 type transport system ATP-binding protein